MGHKGTVRLAQILANRSKAALEEAVLLITEQLGFRYFMFCGRFSQLRGATHEVRFDNFPVHWHRYCADRGRDLLPGPLRRLALQEVTPFPGERSLRGMARPSPRRANSDSPRGFLAPSTDLEGSGASPVSRWPAAAPRRSGVSSRLCRIASSSRAPFTMRRRALPGAGSTGLGRCASSTALATGFSATARANA